ncbi:UNVERIFIED_CONTAM: hypothetical protein LK11_49790 [Mumia flava]|uniref:DMT family transporter n=1 Tax=Mumia flava TaxID=1348852 RepID=UPI00057488D8|nr:SMR family transporter [Mumia flava]
MKSWLLLGTAIGLEVAGSLSLSAGQDAPAWYVVTVVGYLGAFVGLWLVLRTGMPLGVAYGVWGASGVALTALGGTVLLGDPFTLTMGIGIVLVALGILAIETGSRSRPSLERSEP